MHSVSLSLAQTLNTISPSWFVFFICTISIYRKRRAIFHSVLVCVCLNSLIYVLLFSPVIFINWLLFVEMPTGKPNKLSFFLNFIWDWIVKLKILLITQHCCLWWPESDTDVINGTSAHIVKVGEIKPLLSVWFVCSSVYGIWHACMHAYFSLYKTLKYSHKISCWFTAHIYLYPCTRTFCKIQNVTYCRWMSKYFIVSCRVMNSTPFKVRL